MRSGGHPLVPVLIHQVGHDHARRLVEVGIFVFRARHGLHLGDEEQVASVGREGEALQLLAEVGELSAVRAVGVHLPHLAASALAAQEGDLRALLDPRHVALRLRGVGDLLVARAVGVHHEDFAVALVLRHAVVAHGVGNLLAVGRNLVVAYASEGPESLGGHPSVLDLDVRLPDQVARGLVGLLRCGAGSQQERGGHHHCSDRFIHVLCLKS